MLQAYDELAQDICFNKDCEILSSQNAEALPSGYDLVYIDPPYINLEQRYNRDDYWRRYHFLEGLTQYRDWKTHVDLSSDIRLLTQPQWMKDWSGKPHFKEKLFSLVEKHRHSIVVLSYVTNAYPDESQIKTHFERLFSSVSVHTREHSHALSRSSRRELLFVGRP
jgi:adenine-specific DNA-methyltransferase